MGSLRDLARLDHPEPRSRPAAGSTAPGSGRGCRCPARLSGLDFTVYGGRSLDAVFGGMVETRQIRKLPIGFLLLLLVVYLVVHRAARPIGGSGRSTARLLTWITFPRLRRALLAHDLLIGYKLRAARSSGTSCTSWIVLPQGDGTRGGAAGTDVCQHLLAPVTTATGSPPNCRTRPSAPNSKASGAMATTTAKSRSR